MKVEQGKWNFDVHRSTPVYKYFRNICTYAHSLYLPNTVHVYRTLLNFLLLYLYTDIPLHAREIHVWYNNKL